MPAWNQEMSDKTKNEKKDKPKSNLLKSASSTAMANDHDWEPHQVPVPHMQDTILYNSWL